MDDCEAILFVNKHHYTKPQTELLTILCIFVNDFRESPVVRYDWAPTLQHNVA
jgi:hypothetical protein